MRRPLHLAVPQEEPLSPYWRGFISGGIITVCIILIIGLGMLYATLMGVVP